MFQFAETFRHSSLHVRYLKLLSEVKESWKNFVGPIVVGRTVTHCWQSNQARHASSYRQEMPNSDDLSNCVSDVPIVSSVLRSRRENWMPLVIHAAL